MTWTVLSLGTLLLVAIGVALLRCLVLWQNELSHGMPVCPRRHW